MIRLAHPKIPDTVYARMAQIFESGHLTGGSHVQELEEALSRRLGGARVLLMSSGTTASLIAFHCLQQLGAQRVVVPDFCYPSVVSSALRLGLDVRLADVAPGSLNIDIVALESEPRGSQTVMMSVDQFGIPGPNATLKQLARKNNWSWFEDAACALGSSCRGEACGTESHLSILSFHPRKTLTTAEGGALVTTDPELGELAQHLRNQGIGGLGAKRQFLQHGYNARLSELHAAVGLAQLEIFDEILSVRRTLGRRYLEHLGDNHLVSVPEGYAQDGSNFQTFGILLPEGSRRLEVIEGMKREGVETTMAGFSIHRQPAFEHLPRLNDCSVSRCWYERGLALPVHERMSIDDVDTVVSALKRVVGAGQWDGPVDFEETRGD